MAQSMKRLKWIRATVCECFGLKDDVAEFEVPADLFIP